MTPDNQQAAFDSLIRNEVLPDEKFVIMNKPEIINRLKKSLQGKPYGDILNKPELDMADVRNLMQLCIFQKEAIDNWMTYVLDNLVEKDGDDIVF